jgi:hypothetical protein
MNNKLSKAVGVFLVLALFLNPIYAEDEENAQVIEIPESIVVDNDIISTGEVLEFPERPIEIPFEDSNISTPPITPPQDHLIDGVIDFPGEIEEIPIVSESTISIRLDKTKIITKENSITLTGRIRSERTDVRVKYKIRGTDAEGDCNVLYDPETIPIADIDPAIELKQATLTCVLDIAEQDTKEYIVSIIAVDSSSNTATKEVDLTIDRIPPIVTVNDLSTRDRSPILSGTLDDLTAVDFRLTIDGKEYAPEVTDGVWEIQLETLAAGKYAVEFYAKDEAENIARENFAEKVDIRRGGGTRIVAETPTETVTPGPAPETPAAQPVVTQPTVVNVPTTPTTPATGRTPAQTAPTTGNIPVANPSSTSGSTGFLGLPTGASTSLAIIVGALLVVGTLGYFLFFAKK